MNFHIHGTKNEVLTALNEAINASDVLWKGRIKDLLVEAVNAEPAPSVQVTVNMQQGLMISVTAWS